MATTPYVDPDSVFEPAVGEALPAAWLTTVRDALEFLVRPPGVKAIRTTTQSIPNGAWTSVEFTAPDVWDTDAYHNPASSPAVITIPAGLGGWYQINALIVWAANTTGNRGIRGLVNGSTVIGGDTGDSAQIAGGLTGSVLADEVLLAAGDTLEIQGYHQAGAALNITGGSAGQSARVAIRMTSLP